MVYKVAFAGDLHKRPKDVSTIKGYVKCCDLVQDSLIKFIQDEHITHFVSLGDWYDKGYVDDVSSAIADCSKDEYMHKILNGNFYGVIGNHIRLRLDSNPELMLIQPHPTIKSRKPVKRDIPIIKTPSSFMLGSVQISLVHHIVGATSVSDYSIHRLPNATYHIACVHDPKFIPNSVMSRSMNIHTNTMNTQLEQVLSGVDLCICGDIHMCLGMHTISTFTKLYVPGSLSNTTASTRGRHGSINIPILTVNTEEDSFSISMYNFDIHTNTVTFDEKSEEKVSEKLYSIRGNSIKELYGDRSVEGIFTSGISGISFSSFLQQNGYKQSDKDLVKSVVKTPDNISSMVKLHRDGGRLEELI